MKWRIIIVILFLTFGFTTLSANQRIPAPEQGILDLRERDINDQSIFDLDGEWKFHWEKLLTPDNFRQHEAGGLIVNVPSYWNSYQINGKDLPGYGYGTYSLTVFLPTDFQSTLCFDIPLYDVAYRFYLNQRLVAENGEVGTSREEEDPWYEPNSFCYVPDSDTLCLLIQVSNFHHRRGGFWQTLVMGSSKKIMERKERRRIFNYSTIGVLFFFMIFFLIFWSFTRKEMLMLLFALTTLGILIRAVNTGLYFSNFFIDTPWSWQIRMEYLGSYLAAMFGMLFLHRLFPRRYMKRIIQVNTSLMVLAAISLFILPVHIFSYEMLAYQPILVLFLAHYLIISFLGTLQKNLVSIIFFTSLSLFIFTLINDILLANTGGSIYGNYLSQLSFEIFIVAMAVLIILQWVQNDRARQKLESSLRFKNRLLSVIAHDLKNPIASLAQFSDLLVSKPELASKKHVVNSLRESSQAALTMLDNLLYWGRNESASQTISPEKTDMKKLVKEVASLYQHMAQQKEVVLNTDAKSGIFTFADPLFVNIILRNLVANAIKFTRKGGSVSIRTWQEQDHVCFSVIDTGIGIKPELLEQYRKEGALSSTSGTDQEIGTGLGLQLVREMLEQNKGSLEIESKLEEGSTFTIYLPGYKDDENENKKD